MKRNLIVLPDGREIFSGAEGAAILAVEREESVNSQSFLMPGTVCAALVQIRILDAGEGLIRAGDALQLYTVTDAGRSLVGTFIAQKPTRNGKILTVAAYDGLTLLDKPLSGWLKSLDGWPYSLWELADMTCRQCGLEYLPQEIPNGDLTVQPFPFEGVTGRQLLSWIAQAAGCFCKATPEGKVTFDWYAESDISLSVGGTPEMWCCEGGILRLQLRNTAQSEENTLALEAPALQAESSAGELALTFRESAPGYSQGGLSLQDFETPPIGAVQIRQSDDDVGTVYPAQGENPLIITGNPLLAARDATSLLPVAQVLFEKFRGISYTPCTVTLPENDRISVGQILLAGEHKIYVMGLRRAGGQMVITCSGEQDPQGALIRAQQSYEGVAGKILRLRTDVDGIFAENSDSRGKLARLQLDVDGLQAQTEAAAGLQTQLTKLEQTADAIRLSVEKITDEGAAKIKTAVGYTFDDQGLQISREGQQMKNLLDNTGMYVTRSGQTVLQANDAGVTAVDVKVGNFLIVGDHARFENYGAGRTACYWLEG